MRPTEGKQQYYYQPYSITMSRHQLSVVELRVLGCVLFSLKSAQFILYKSPEKYAQLVPALGKCDLIKSDVLRGSNYRLLNLALENLKTKKISIQNKAGVYKDFQLIKKFSMGHQSTSIEIELCPQILPELLNLGKSFTKILKGVEHETKSRFTIRWHQIISHWRKSGRFQIKTTNLRPLFGVDNAYPKTSKCY